MCPSNGTINHRKALFSIAIMLSGTLVAMLNQTLLAPALPSIMADLQITATQGQWLTTGFMLVNGIMIPITAYLISRFTTRALFMTSMGIFTAGTILAGISPTFESLLFARILQATGAGMLMPLQQTSLLLLVPKEKRGSAMGLVGLVMVFAPAIGPTLSGWMVDQFHWHYLFLIIAPIALLDIALGFFFMTNVGEPSKPTLDIPSVIYSTLGFGGLLYGFSIAGEAGWTSAITLSTLALGAASLFIFSNRQLKLDQPLLELRVFQNKTFMYSTVLGMILNAGLIAGGIMMPIYVQNIRGYAAIDSGLMMLPGAILMGVMSPFTGKLFDKVGPRPLALAGLVIQTLTTAGLSMLTETTSLGYLTVLYTIRSAGFALLMMPLTTWGLNALDNSLISHGTACSNTFRQVAGSIGTALLITVMTVCTNGSADLGPTLSTIRGINAAFACATLFSVITLVMAFFVIKTPQQSKEKMNQALSN